jgi:hypothetical protein
VEGRLVFNQFSTKEGQQREQLKVGERERERERGRRRRRGPEV